MASPSTPLSPNPRRAPVSLHVAGSAKGLGLDTTMLRKGATFHSPSSPVADFVSSFSPPRLPRAHSDLDDVVDAHRRRAALALDHIEKVFTNKSGNNAVFLDKDTDSLPVGLAHHDAAPAEYHRRVLSPRSVNRRQPNHHHTSDSGLGSSIASDKKHNQQHQQQGQDQTVSSTASTGHARAVTRSVAAATVAASAAVDKSVGLSVRATNRIYEHTVKPLLAKSAYRDFHPVLLECTTKINNKDIVCLRDLEKIILILAPERTKSAKRYLDFCLDSVLCLQTTVQYLSEREQTRPSDLPYTAGYFIDLVDQIHRYAQQLADARNQEKAGVVDMDVHSSDTIKLHGGIAVNGRPAELVRISRDGRAVSMASGLPVELEEDYKDSIRVKRSVSQEAEDEEEIMRSMARRKKNAPPEEYAPKMCSVPGCSKEFKRPCDLTKHEKTHSRPWKCPMESCKYHEYGWPTEKERDRHMNDKHSENPPMYECQFKPCTYKSKRQSNCKQHMEKTHNWTYVRTKTNGASKAAVAGIGAAASAGATAAAGPAAPTPSTSRSHKPSSVSRASLEATSTTQPTPQLVNLPTPVSAQSPVVATPPFDEFSAPLFNPLAELDFPTCAPADIQTNLPSDINDLDLSPMLPMDLGGNGLGNSVDAVAYGSPSTVSSVDNASAYQDIGQDMTMYDDIYSANMRVLTEQPLFAPGYAQKDLDEFLALQPDRLAHLMTPAQQQQIARMQEMRQPTQPTQVAQLQQQAQSTQPASYQQQQQMLPPQSLPYISPISPLGEANAMLYTPDSLVDEGFMDYDYADEAFKMTGADFVLYPQSDMTAMTSSSHMTTVPAITTAYKTDTAFDALLEDMPPSIAAGFSQPTSQVFDTNNTNNMGW